MVEAKTGRVQQRRHATYREPGGTQITDSQAHGTTTILSDSAKRPYDSVVAAMSRNLGALSRDIAKVIAGGS